MKKRVFVGVSGGIDSAASLFILMEQGYDVKGVFLFMRGDKVPERTISQLNEISNRTGVEIMICDVRERFKEFVIKPFINSYLKGETPSPCAQCNPLIKWHSLIQIADDNGGGYVATGHYCGIKNLDGLYYLTKGTDTLKDQSYYMWQLSQDVLSRILFPLGEKSKSEVRLYMKAKVWDEITRKSESMGICFLDNKNYSEWLTNNCPEIAAVKEGDVINRKGEIVGKHKGYPFYTLAQKKGFTIEKGETGLSVVEIDIKNNTLTVGDKNELMTSVLYLRDWQFISTKEVLSEKKLIVKVRGIGLNPDGYCNIEIQSNRLKVTLNDDKAWAVTSGQPAVFYIDNRLVGGGIVV